jgi:hypothetical protein
MRSRPWSARPVVTRSKALKRGKVVGSIMAAVIRIHAQAYSAAGTTTSPPGTTLQMKAAGPDAVQSSCSI